MFTNEVTPMTSAPVPRSSSPSVPDGNEICCVVQSFPKHDMVKLKEENLHPMATLVEAYHRCVCYIHGMLPISHRFIPDSQGKLLSNPEFISFHQQDKLLASWLLSMTSGELLSSFIGTAIAYDV